MKIKKTPFIVFGLLLLSIYLSFFLSGNSFEQSKDFIIGISFLKFILISYFFMDLRNAHFLWKAIIFILIFGFSLFIKFYSSI
ncbi:MAG: prokaryotic cytochrome C oxidase subunit IV [Leptospiraceae bacterium]|nr:prokaryotic cytochrome C oxidase subunit IV [Leptospiraceae bacterium]